jgi:hypothetical protein
MRRTCSRSWSALQPSRAISVVSPGRSPRAHHRPARRTGRCRERRARALGPRFYAPRPAASWTLISVAPYVSPARSGASDTWAPRGTIEDTAVTVLRPTPRRACEKAATAQRGRPRGAGWRPPTAPLLRLPVLHNGGQSHRSDRFRCLPAGCASKAGGWERWQGDARGTSGERHSVCPGATAERGRSERRIKLRRGSCVLLRVGARCLVSAPQRT